MLSWICCANWTRFPHWPDPSLGSPIVSRRLLMLAPFALVLLFSAGCGNEADSAIRVGDTRISYAEFQKELDEWVANTALLDPNLIEAPAPGAYQGDLVRGLAAQRIDFELTRREFEAQGLVLDDAMRAEVVTVVFGEQATADQQLAGFSASYRVALIDSLARQIGLSSALGEDDYPAWRVAALKDTDIAVSPRYGRWDSGTATVIAPSVGVPSGT